MAAVLGMTCRPTGPSAADGTSLDFEQLVERLRRTVATVQPGGPISQPFFAVPGRAVAVNGEDVQVFEYPDESAAAAEAGRVSPDGATIGTTSILWTAPPHFFRKGRLLVLCVGDAASVKRALESVLGSQIAGR